MDLVKFLQNAGGALMNAFKPANIPDIPNEVYHTLSTGFHSFQNQPDKTINLAPPPPPVNTQQVQPIHNDFLNFINQKYYQPITKTIGQDLGNFSNHITQSIGDAVNAVGSQPLIDLHKIGINYNLPSPTVGQAADFVRSATIQPLARIGAEGAMSLTGDKGSYTPQNFSNPGVAHFLYGNDPLQSYSNPQRPSRVFLHDMGFNQQQINQYAPMLIGAGIVADVGSNLVPGEGKTAEEAGITGAKTIAGQFNKRNLQLTEDGAKAIDAVVQEAKPKLEQMLGSVLSNKDVIQAADQTSNILKSVVTKDQTKAWETAMLKARQALTDSANNGTLDKSFLDNFMVVKSQGTDIARKLQSLSISADPKLNTMKNTILQAVLDTTQNADEILKAAQGVDFNNTEQATTFLRNFVQPKAGEWLDKLRYSSMLSSPITHMVNSTSNLFNTSLLAPVEKTLTGGLDWLHSGLTGAPRKYAANEGINYATGYLSNLKNAATKFADVMSGKSLSNMQEIYQLPLSKAGTPQRVIENVLSFPTRLLQANDEFFQTLTEGGINKALQARANAGIKTGGDIAGQAYTEARHRLFNADMGKESSHILQAIEYLPSKVMEARNSSNPIVRTIAKFSFPFVKVPVNVTKQSIEYSPLGLSTLWGAQNKTEQLSKAIIGSSIGTAFAMMVSSNRLTWSEPTGAKEKAAFRAAGLQPYSVKIGNNWVSYSQVPPALSFPMALVAALKTANDQKHLSDSQVEVVLNGLAGWTQFYADRSYLKNVSDLVSATQGDQQGMARFGGTYIQQGIPFRALMGWVEKIVDPSQRQADPNGNLLQKQLQQIMTQIPGVAGMVPTRNDQFGQPIPNQNRGINAISPAKVTTEVPQAKSIYDQMQQTKQQNQILNDLKSGKGSVSDITGLSTSQDSNAQATTPTGNKMVDLFNQEATDSKKAAIIKQIFALNLPQVQTEQLLKQNNAGSYQDTQYVILKSLSTEHRAQVYADMAGKLSNQDFVNVSTTLADKGILTSAVVTELLDTGKIDANQAASLKQLIKQTNAKGASHTGRKLTLSKPTLAHTTLHMPKGSTGRIKLVKIKPIAPLKAGKLGKLTKFPTKLAKAYTKGGPIGS